MLSRQGSPKASSRSPQASLAGVVAVLAPLACLLYATFSLGIYYGASEAEHLWADIHGLAAEQQQRQAQRGRRSLRVGHEGGTAAEVRLPPQQETPEAAADSAGGSQLPSLPVPEQVAVHSLAAAAVDPAEKVVPPPPAAWLYTLVGSDYEGTAALLPHWLHHYLGKLAFSKDRLLVVVNHNSTRDAAAAEHAAVLGVLAEWGVPFRLWTDRYSSDAHLKVKLGLLSERVTSLEEWVSIADSDEFQSYSGVGGGAQLGGGRPKKSATIGDALRAAEAAGANFVMGQMVDRVSADGVLAPVRPVGSLFAQFPNECHVVQRLTKGYTYKVVAFKAYWRTNTGNHFIVSPDRAKKYFSAAAPGAKNARGGWLGAEDLFALTPYSSFPWKYQFSGQPRLPALYRPAQFRPTLPVYHFKWHAGVLQSAQDRYEHYKGNVSADGAGLPRYNHYFESRNVLKSLQGGRIDLQEAGCTLDHHFREA